MKRKVVAMTLAITISLPVVPVSDLYQTQAAVVHETETSDAAAVREAETADGAVYEDISDQLIQEGGFPTGAADDGIMPMSDVDDAVKKQVQEKLMEAWDSVSDECDLTEFQLTREEVRTIYFDTINQYPRYFFLDKNYSFYSNAEGLVTKLVNIGYSTKDTAQIANMLKEYDAVIAKVKSNADPSWSDMEKALYVNDYLARNCAYDENYFVDDFDQANLKYNAYNALVDKSAVCEGYALAFRELTQQLGLSCEIVESDTLNHEWNLVKINGSYYHVDVTWNDPASDQVPDRIGKARHYYFMKSSSFFQSDQGGHAASDWQITGGLTGDAASDAKYDAYFWNASDAGFEYIDGNWYGFNGKEDICKYTCSGTDFKEAESIQKIEDVWNMIGNSNGYWQGKFVGLGASNGSLIYSGKDKIYELDVQTKTSEQLFELTQEQKQAGHIYSINVTPSGEIEYLFAESPNVNGTVYKAEFDSSRIVFDGNSADGGSMSDMVLFRPNQEYSLPANLFTKKGYDFKGWNTQADGSGTAYEDKASVSQASIGGSGITLYAQWEAQEVTEQSYEIVYDGNGAESGSMEKQVLNEAGQSYELRANQFVREGYEFKGWNTKADGSGTSYASDGTISFTAEESGSGITLYAQWEAQEVTEQSYEVVYDGNGAESGSMDKQVLSEAGQSYNLSANQFVREGYEFKGWNTKADGSGTSYASDGTISFTAEESGSGITLYAQWEAQEVTEQSYEVVYDGNGAESGSMDKQVLSEAGRPYNLSANQFVREGYVFKGWNTKADGSGMSYASDGTISFTAEESGSGITLYAQWEAQEVTEHSYEVVYDGNGAESGSMDKQVLSEAGRPYNLSDNQFVREGYVFKGWNTKADGTGTSYASDGTISFTAEESGSGITLYAQWEAQEAHIHTIVEDPAVAPTCTEAGKTLGSHCSVCGEVIQAQETVPALGHSWNSGYTVDVAPTYSETGRESIHCRNCSEVKDSRIIPRLTGSSSSSSGSYWGNYPSSNPGVNNQTNNTTTTASKTNPDGSVTKTTTTKHTSGAVDTDITTTRPDGSIAETTAVRQDASGRTQTETKKMDAAGKVTETAVITSDASGSKETRETRDSDGRVVSNVIIIRDALGKVETETTTTTEQISPAISKVTETIVTPAGTEKTETTTERRADGALVQTQAKTAADGQTTVVTSVTNMDGSVVQTASRTAANTHGMAVETATTTRMDSEGNVADVTEKSVIRGLENTGVTVTVKKDGTGSVYSAGAAVTRQAGSGNTAVLSGSVISQIKEAAGQDVEVTMTVQGTDGSNLYKLRANTEDLHAGNKLRIYWLRSTGEYVMVNAGTYTVSSNGNVTVSMANKVTYELVSQEKAAGINRQILRTAASARASVTLKRKGSIQFAFRTGLNRQNVKSIRYQTSNKKVASVSRTGKIKGKKAGTAVVKAAVALKNGSSKTVSMRVRVK